MQNFRRTDRPAEPVIFYTKIEDYIGGVTLHTGGFSEGDIVPGGSIVGKESGGLFRVIKTVKLQAPAANNATVYRVLKGSNFKVGEFITEGPGKVAVTVNAVNTTNADYDELTLSATLGVAYVAGQVLVQAKAASASTSEFIIAPWLVTERSVYIRKGDNNHVGAWLRATVFEDNVPPVSTAMKDALTVSIKWMR